MYPLKYLLLLAGYVSLIAGFSADLNAVTKYPLDSLYREAQRDFQRKDFDGALINLKKYIQESRVNPYKRERLVWVIDQVGAIYLRNKKDPNAALKFFRGALKDKRLTDAEMVTIEEWIGAANDLVKYGKSPKNLNEDQLFEAGRKFFKDGIGKVQSPRDDSGNASFHIASSYLVPFITKNNDDERVGEALLMMGRIRRHVINDNEYWVENYYLKEVIRRFPHTKIAQRAFKVLESEIHHGFTGSSGDHTPESLVKMLNTFRELSKTKVKTSKTM